MSFEIKNTKDIARDGVKVLVFAASGFGKTRQLGSLRGKTLILSAESGLLVLKNENVDVIDITSLEQLGEVYVALQNKELVYDNVCLDSLSEIGDMIVDTLMRDEYYADPSNAFPLWKEYTKIMTNLCKKFRDLKGINIILTALNEPVENNGSIKYMPLIPAKRVQAKLVSVFDEVYYCSMDKDENRVIHTEGTNTYDAKTRGNIANKTILSEVAENESMQTAEVSLGTIIEQINIKG